MKPLSISSKAAIAFGALVLLVFGMGWLGVTEMGETAARTHRTFAEQSARAQLAQEAMRYITLNSRLSMTSLLLKDPAQIQALTAQRTENSKAITGVLDRLKRLAGSPQEREAAGDHRERPRHLPGQ